MKAFRVAGDSVQVSALVMPDASMVCGRAETIAHQRAVGHHADLDVGRPQQQLHPVDRAGRPAVGERVAQRVDRVDDEDQRADHVAVDERAGGADGDRAVGRADLRGEYWWRPDSRFPRCPPQ